MLDAPVRCHGQAAVKTAQFRITCDRGLHMPGHIDLRDDLDIFGMGVCDHLADFILRVKSTVGLVAEIGVGTFGAEFGQPRVLFDLYAPALILRQMPVEDVELMYRHHIEKMLDLIHRIKIAPHVEHKATVRIKRAIVNHKAGNFKAFREQNLLEGLQCIEKAGFASRRD